MGSSPHTPSAARRRTQSTHTRAPRPPPYPPQNLIYLAGSASAEFIADIALCPFEAVKVHC